MAVFDNRHSRIVAWLKVVFPILSLVILSTLFLASGRDGGTDLPVSAVELDRIVEEGRVANPSYSGTFDDGSAVSLSVGTLFPDARGGARGDRVLGVVEPVDGGRFDLSADRGDIAPGGDLARLSGAVRLRDAAGYRVRSDGMEIALDGGAITSPGPVTADGPPGRISAGAMTLRRGTDGYVLDFTGGVRMLYQPPSEGEE